MLRIVLGLLAGAVVGGVVVGLVAYLGRMVTPSFGAGQATLVEAARAALAWGLAALTGGFVAARIAARAWAAWAIAALLLIASLYNVFVIPSPNWLWIGGLGAIVVLGWLAGRVGAPPKAA